MSTRSEPPNRGGRAGRPAQPDESESAPLSRPGAFSPVRTDEWTLRVDALGRTRMDFFGPTSTRGLREGIAALERVMPKGDDKIDLVIDLNRLVGHNPDSRAMWTEWLVHNKRKLNLVLVVVPQAASLIKMVAAAVGLAAGIRLRVVSGNV